MNKQRFLNIVQDHVFADNDEVALFEKMATQYPYSQIIHTLVAKHHHEVKSSDAKASIQKAAIYATDRVVLKKIIESSPKQVVVKEPTSLTSAPPIAPPIPQESPEKSERTGVSDINQLRKDLYLHLEELQQSKKPFKVTQSTPTKKKVRKEVFAKTKVKTKKKTIVKKKTKIEQKPAQRVKKKVENNSKILSQKEQVDLIEKFIKSPPKITKNKIKSSVNEDQEDLSVKSTKIEEDFASENLAKILIKQGNKEKAIDIYKKLIWKFPQKKAYFATQIEGLKK